MEEFCDVLQLQDKKTYFIHLRPISQLSPAGLLHGSSRHALSFLLWVQGMSDGCGVFTEEVLLASVCCVRTWFNVASSHVLSQSGDGGSGKEEENIWAHE